MNKRAKYQRVARFYDFLDSPFETKRYQPLRRQLWQGLSRRILDAGVGTGRNMAFYPPDGETTGIDLSPAMLARAKLRQRELGVTAELLEMNVLDTAFANDQFDAVVATFLFCVLDDEHQAPALRELARICKPGGVIHILEYSYSQDPMRRFMMRLWAPWVRLLYGARFDRRTEDYVADAGLRLVDKRFLFHDVIKLLVLEPG